MFLGVQVAELVAGLRGFENSWYAWPRAEGSELRTAFVPADEHKPVQKLLSAEWISGGIASRGAMCIGRNYLHMFRCLQIGVCKCKS
jgi:hypothetical protein